MAAGVAGAPPLVALAQHEALVEQGGVEQPGVREFSGRLLVRPFRPDAADPDARRRAAAARERLDPWRIRTVEPMDLHVLRVPPGETEATLAARLLETGDYEIVEPDWIVYPLGLEPSDPAYQWHLRKVDCPSAWSRTTGDGSITIAFVDTGIDAKHPDLAPLLVPGLNSVLQLPEAEGGEVSDVNGHGTSVAGAAAAMGNNGLGCCGIGWSLPIMPIRASNSPSGGAFLSDVAYGAVWAALRGARVVSVSFAGVETASAEATASAVRDRGGLLVWGAGNSGQSLNFDRPYTTVVGATSQSDGLAPDSNFGPAIDVVAPGVSLYLPAKGGGWRWCTGTSYAAPVASGVLALLWSANPGLTPDQAMAALYGSCDDLGPAGRDDVYGWGRVNAARAVSRVLPPAATDVDLFPATVSGPEAEKLPVTYYRVGSVCSPAGEWDPWGASIVGGLDFRLPAGGTLPGAPPPVQLGAVFEGALSIETAGAYTFTLESDGCARVLVGGRVVVDSRGAGGVRTRAGSIGLMPGRHVFRCEYSTDSGPITLVLRMRGPGFADQVIPGSLLTHTQE